MKKSLTGFSSGFTKYINKLLSSKKKKGGLCRQHPLHVHYINTNAVRFDQNSISGLSGNTNHAFNFQEKHNLSSWQGEANKIISKSPNKHKPIL